MFFRKNSDQKICLKKAMKLAKFELLRFFHFIFQTPKAWKLKIFLISYISPLERASKIFSPFVG